MEDTDSNCTGGLRWEAERRIGAGVGLPIEGAGGCFVRWARKRRVEETIDIGSCKQSVHMRRTFHHSGHFTSANVGRPSGRWTPPNVIPFFLSDSLAARVKVSAVVRLRVNRWAGPHVWIVFRL